MGFLCFASILEYMISTVMLGKLSHLEVVVLLSLLSLLFFVLSLILFVMNISKNRLVRNQILTGRKILLAEDDVISQRIWTSLLKENNVMTTLAVNGMEAVNYAKGNSFDLILMDIEMPILNGMEATREIRERMEEDKAYIPILALTAHSSQGEKAEALLEVGFDDILTKPINPKLFRSKLIYWLSHSGKKISSGSDRSYKFKAFSSVTNNSLNVKKGLGYTDNNEELYITLLKRFVTNYGSLEINGNTPFTHEIETLLHNLKGIAGSLGADSLRKATVALGESFSRKSWDRRSIEVFIKKHADTISDCEEILAEYWTKHGKSQVAQVLPLDELKSVEQLKEVLIHLRVALGQCDPIQCRNIVEEIEGLSHPGYSVHMFDSIFQKVAEYQYDVANQKVEKLIERIEMEE